MDPLTKPRPIGLGRCKREIPNSAGASLTKELTKWILRAPLKFIWLINSFIKLRCYLPRGAAVLNRVLSEWLIPYAKLKITPGRD